MKKRFDCVEMQHQGGKKLQAKLAEMTLDEQVAYWERREKELRNRQAESQERRKAS